MSASLDRRTNKLEGVLPNREFMSKVLGLLREIGYEELRSEVASQGMTMLHALLLCVDDMPGGSRPKRPFLPPRGAPNHRPARPTD